MAEKRSLWQRLTGRGSIPAEMASEIASTRDGRDITRPWVRELEEAHDPKLIGSVGWGVYDRILLDAQVKSCMEQRIRAVVSREWTVLSGEDGNPKADAAAEALSDAIQRVGWDRITEKMLYAILFGPSVAELFWKPIDGLLAWSQIRVRHARRFRYDTKGRLRLLTSSNMRGEILPERKFWVVTSGGTDDDHPYGRGLAEWLYFPVLFKRNGVRFWNIALDKFSVPTAVGKYPRGTSKADQEKLLASLLAIATDSGFAIPEGMDVKLLEMAQKGVDFEAVCRYMDGEIAKVILSQTMTTDNGSSRSQAEVHNDVKLEIVKADADLLTDSFANGPARWFTDLNFGTDVPAPRVMRIVEEEDDLKAAAETDEILDRMGWVRTPEAFADRYGEGYVRKETVKQPEASEPPEAANDQDKQPEAIALAAFDPKTLYVYRRLRNTDDLIEWAREQGLTRMLPASDLHVTVAYSRRAVNWFKVADEFVSADDLIVAPGGPRIVDRIGDQGAIALHFFSGPLTWRNQSMRDRGASWDHADYHPHLTLTYSGDGIDLSKIEPYRGKLVFGPEIFEALDDSWAEMRQEVSLAEGDGEPTRDAVDAAIDEIMADEGWRDMWAPVVEPLVEKLQAAATPEEALQILSREAGVGDGGELGEMLARAGFALRIDAATEGGDQ